MDKNLHEVRPLYIHEHPCNERSSDTLLEYRQPNVYSVFIDASKAFDQVRYNRLFQVLYDRGLPLIIITRLIIDMYIRQQSRTVWNGQYSNYFSNVNGVRQGGVASHVVFTVYMDELILELKRSGIGCHIGHKYYRSLGYADDFKLRCPSIKSLQKMVNICAQFGKRFDVQYNAKKSFCIAFSRAVDLSNGLNENNTICLNGSRLEWTKSVKDFGNHVNYNLLESEEIRLKRGEFIGRVNGLLVQYGNAHLEVQMYLLYA